MKKFVLLLAAVILASVLIIFPLSAEASFSGYGSGTVGDPYMISTIEELQAMNDNLSAHYKLGSIIYFEGETFTPIGNESNPFTGSFNGNSFWILNLTISSSEDYIGLFGHTGPGASIMKVGLQMITVTGNDRVGGLVGHNGGNISECLVNGTVTGYDNVGGLVGINEGLIINSYSTADVDGANTVGGLVGLNDGGDINRTYAVGAVAGTTFVGGLVGQNDAGNVIASYFDNETTGQTGSAGGYAKTTEQMMNQTTFVGWDFDDVWRINDGISYPRLQTIVTLEDIEEIIDSPNKVTAISIEEQPNLVYDYGDELNLTNMIVNLSWSDGTFSEVGFADFVANDLSAYPEHGTVLDSGHHISVVTVNHNEEQLETETETLSVNPVLSSMSVLVQPNLHYYNGDNLDLGSIVLKQTFSDGSFEIISYDEFTTNYLITVPGHGDNLNLSHDGERVTISHSASGISTETNILSVTLVTIDDEEDSVCAVPFAIMLIFGMSAIAMRRR